MMKFLFRGLIAVAMVALLLSVAHGGMIAIDTVTIGNTGNTGELSGASADHGYGPDITLGAVGYVYNIGTGAVTAGQYVEFLNAVATDGDAHELYNPLMETADFPNMIHQEGMGTFTYSFSDTAANWENRPICHVSFGDAARFCNWLHNGCPVTGSQTAVTTEDGAYDLSSNPTTDAEWLAISRESDWKWAIPSENEWYKAAFHKNDGNTGNYFDYATGSDTFPANGLNEGGNSSTYAAWDDDIEDWVYTIGDPYWRTENGAHADSPSPYDTFDQSGNTWEWNEAVIEEDGVDQRGARGGAFLDNKNLSTAFQTAGFRGSFFPTLESYNLGFRVVQVSSVPGDTDGDGDVDADDAAIVAAHWGLATEAGAAEGDFDGDGVVGPKDASIMAAHWSGSTESSATTVPEPSVLAMFVAVLGLAALRRRRP